MFIDNILYGNAGEFSDSIYDVWSEADNEVGIVCDYFIASDLLKEFAKFDGFDLYDICLSPNEEDFGENYMIAIDECGDIVCMPICMPNNEFPAINPEVFDIVYVFEDINSKFCEINSKIRMVEVDYEEHDCDGDCENCTKEEPDDMYTQTFTTKDGSYFTRSFYSTDAKSMSEVRKEWDEFAKQLMIAGKIR